MGDLEHEHRRHHEARPPRIPHRTLRPAAFALRDLPSQASVAQRIQQLRVLAPTQHEAQVVSQQQPEPESTGKPLIEDMDHFSSPTGCQFHKPFAFFITFLRRHGGRGWSTSAGRPAGAGLAGRAVR